MSLLFCWWLNIFSLSQWVVFRIPISHHFSIFSLFFADESPTLDSSYHSSCVCGPDSSSNSTSRTLGRHFRDPMRMASHCLISGSRLRKWGVAWQCPWCFAHLGRWNDSGLFTCIWSIRTWYVGALCSIWFNMFPFTCDQTWQQSSTV